MTAQSLKSFLTNEFVDQASDTLAADGFISDEHDFAPYRETVSTHVESIQNALQDRGFDIELSAGFVKGKDTYAYFIYDTDRFVDSTAAKAAVSRWLDRRD
ncbi:hypothetical protein [Dyella choica]|uniref:Uncharacterized protein n=1 Tax=Dyella choica TaxID=1927959 RepID=A0A3S0R5P7_9GAMM|nr:hypothetical protein [Dyella choica]RUL78774.1 hypothetical protein EKH80_02885 [Dyella choica]